MDILLFNIRRLLKIRKCFFLLHISYFRLLRSQILELQNLKLMPDCLNLAQSQTTPTETVNSRICIGFVDRDFESQHHIHSMEM